MRFKLEGTDSPRDAAAAPRIRRGTGGAPGDDGADEESFKRYVAEISRQIAARSARAPVEMGLGPAPVPKVEREELPPRRTLAWTLLVVGATIAAGGLHFLSFDRPIPPATPHSPQTAAWAPPAPPPSPPVDLEPPRPAQTAEVEKAIPPPPPAAVAEPVVVPSSPPAPPPPSADQVREAQSRLRSFGLNPGPVDGVAGPSTTAAVRRYQQTKGQEPTGTIDRDLLNRLRQEPSRPPQGPKTAARQGR